MMISTAYKGVIDMVMMLSTADEGVDDVHGHDAIYC